MKWLIATLAFIVCLAIWLRPRHIEWHELAGKRALVCGASTGIGEQVAYRLASSGAHVMLVARRQAKLDSVAQRCRELGAASATVIVADFSDESGASAAIDAVLSSGGGSLDLLVLNHIVGYFGNWVDDMVVDYRSAEIGERVETVLGVNCHSYIYLASRALPILGESDGRIVVVSSAAGRVGVPHTSVYSASKHCVEGFFEGLRNDLAMQQRYTGVSVTVVPLGNIHTENALANTKGKLEHVRRYPAHEAADAIVEAAWLRERERFYPYAELQFAFWLHSWSPSLLDYITRQFVY
jgi:corticosteroid 11-beta-dehydrogenase isozyme 1